MKLTTKSRFSSATLELSPILNCSPLFFRHPAYCQTPCYRLADDFKQIEANKKSKLVHLKYFSCKQKKIAFVQDRYFHRLLTNLELKTVTLSAGKLIQKITNPQPAVRN